jgi:DNA-binding response OmpR family regulator
MAERILVVEDDPTIREVVAVALADEGYSVREASDGEAALVALRTWPPDLVVLDLMLPGLDGWGILTERRRRNLAPGARFIVLSAHQRTRGADWADPDVVAVIPKPFNLDPFLAAVAAAAADVRGHRG